MEELFCADCNKHVGWMNYAGPHGSVYCDDCKEDEDERQKQMRLEEAAQRRIELEWQEMERYFTKHPHG